MRYFRYLNYMISSLGAYIRNLEANQKEQQIPNSATGVVYYRDGKGELSTIVSKYKRLVVLAFILGFIIGVIIGAFI